MSGNILEINKLNKYFGPTHANRDIDFSVKKGEIKGLIGENGSGKSTLISQIAGLYRRDSGRMLLDGKEYDPHSPIDANNSGISMVMQELGVVGSLPAGVNVYLGRTGQFTKNGVVSLKALNRAAAEQFEKWDLPKVPLNKLTDGMMIETRKMIELARALSVDPKLLLLDEITQSLSMNNRNKLYELLKKLKAMGRSVIVITHDVEELIKVTDTITVSARRRSGGRRGFGEDDAGGGQADDGRSRDQRRLLPSGHEAGLPGRGGAERSEPDGSNEIEDVSFEVHEGEILGLCGLSDSGIHTVGKAVYGLAKPSCGRVYLKAKELAVKKATKALKSNMAYVPKDRDNEALMLHASILDNFSLRRWASCRAGWASSRRERSGSWPRR
jgi:ribose transport system ATP-binding protein